MHSLLEELNQKALGLQLGDVIAYLVVCFFSTITVSCKSSQSSCELTNCRMDRTAAKYYEVNIQKSLVN